MVETTRRILVVDDEEVVRDSCKRSLTEAGYDVRTVESGHDALKAWLALGTAVASGTIVGLLSDAASGERGVSQSEWQA